MEKFSVKKPFTILVAVIMIVVLGFVAVTRLTMDLLPEMSLPYLMVITTWPGASPEKVESSVGRPMERGLGTINGVKNVYTVSSDNYCMTQLEFEDGTDMDSALVKVSSAVDEVSASLPEGVGTPNIMEISMDMMATMYVAVSRDGYDIYELSDYVRDSVVPELERQNGIASVTDIGMVEKSIRVELDAAKITEVNDRILAKTNKALADALRELNDAQDKVDDGQAELEKQEKAFGETVSASIFDGIQSAVGPLSSELNGRVLSLIQMTRDLQGSLAELREQLPTSEELQEAIPALPEDAGETFDPAAAKEAVDNFRAGADAARQAAQQGGTPQPSVTPDAPGGGQDDPSSGQDGTAGDGQSSDDNTSGDDTGTGQDTGDGTPSSSDDTGTSGTDGSGSETGSDGGTGTETGSGTDGGSGTEIPSDGSTGSLLPTVFPGAVLMTQTTGALPGSDSEAAAQLREVASAAQQAITEAARQAQAQVPAAEQAAQQQQAAAMQAAMQTIQNMTPEQYQQLQALLAQASAALEEASDPASTYSQLLAQATKLSEGAASLQSALDSIDLQGSADALSGQITNARGGLEQLRSGIDKIPSLMTQLESGFGALTQGQLDAAVGFATAASELSNAQKQLDAARTQFNTARDEALKNANLDQLLTTEALSGLIYAQNFSMPAGYIDDEDDNSWLLKVGESYADTESIAEALLVDIDDIGPVRLSDVAEVTIIDNAGDHYAKLNGEDAICLCIFKGSTSGTNQVSTLAKKTMEQIADENEGTRFVPLMDQGIYIDLIVNSILTSMLLGAALAIIVLALFLRDIRPTFVVAISIPLSVLFTIVLMYFSGLSLNMMTLSGLALGIGMLVDNSIVVMENIFRLRGAGLPAPRAAVQGAKQVRGAIIASTLTTVCVFLPMVFTTGTVRELLIPMALSIGYCLMASLVVALTVVPASASTILKKMKPREHGFSRKIMGKYDTALRWCLHHKIITLGVTFALLLLTVWQVIRMGIVLLPEMTSSDIQVNISTDESFDREASYRKTDEVMNAILGVEGVANVGIMDEASTTALFSSMGGDTSEYGNYICYVGADESADTRELKRVTGQIGKATENIEGCTVTVASSDMSDMTALSSTSDLTINIYGSDIDRLTDIRSDVSGIVSSVNGFENISDGSESGEDTLLLVIDKDKAMGYGLTVAQIYTEISQRLTTSVKAATVTIDGVEMEITLYDPTDPLTRENLLDMEFESPAPAEADMFSSGDASALFSSDEDEDAEDADESESSAENEGSDESDKDEEEDDTHLLRDFASLKETTSPAAINRENQKRYLTLTADAAEGENTTLLVRKLETKLNSYNENLDKGYSVEIAGENETIKDMIRQMAKLLALGILFIYLVMVAQFQSLLSPFIILFTVPLAFTGGMFGLMLSGQPLSMLSLMGFLILVGTVVNNGIVFVDYTNQLRIGGLPREEALIATGKTRMRPILMTALTTILAMANLIFGKGMGSQLGAGMAVVIAGGLTYATLMTLFIIPVMYDIMFKKPPLSVDVGSDLDDAPDDAAELIASLSAAGAETGDAGPNAPADAPEDSVPETKRRRRFGSRRRRK